MVQGYQRKRIMRRLRRWLIFLEHFYELTLHVSITSHPTSYTYFHEIANVLHLLREWCHSEDNLSKEIGKNMLVIGHHQNTRQIRYLSIYSFLSLFF